ncbi:MAG: discoidin domain-containing protein, partial [Gemmatimonadota bacterium]|nr:discoidin domain-containing protein [Gemmatimonadota bacterium]
MSRQRNALALVGLLAAAALATENIVVGGDGSGATWQEAAADAPVIDFSSRAGWIQPRSVEENTNIATGILERGGRVTSPNAQAVLRLTSNVLEERLHSMVDGDPNTAFEAKDVVATGILLVVDLGARFGVNHIRFFPRQAFKSDFMKGYVLSTNDGAFGADIIAASVDKLPDKTLVTVMAQDGSNSRDTIDVRFPLQYVRYLRLESTQRFNWEIDELEIFGSGFVPEADYLSEVFDMEQDALWGRLQWATEQVGLPQRSRLIVRTRSGSSPSPDDEPDSWSPWSTPYRNSGDPILSPAPRRYFQFSMAFESDGLEDGIAVDSLAFEVFRPALAQAIVGEIWPQEVPVGVDTSFVYTI